MNGIITPQGAKNEALEVISAVLLTADEVEMSNVPDIQDVNILIEMLIDLGVKVKKTAPNTYIFKADDVSDTISGKVPSPIALCRYIKLAEKSMNIFPSVIIIKYLLHSSIMFLSTFKKSYIGYLKTNINKEIIATAMQIISRFTMITLFIFSKSFAPKSCPTKIPTPVAYPVNAEFTSADIGERHPIAAKASSPINCPAIMVLIIE